MARLSERGKLDFFFIGDRVVGLPETQAEHPNLVLRPEALTLASYVAAVTERIGIVTTVNTTYSDPFNVRASDRHSRPFKWRTPCLQHRDGP